MTWTPIPPIEIFLTFPPPSDHPTLRGPEQYIVTAIFGSIAAVAVIFRLYTRLFTRRYFGIDDWLILVAFVRHELCDIRTILFTYALQICAIGVDVCTTIGKAKFNWDRHLWEWDLSLSRGKSLIYTSDESLTEITSRLAKSTLHCAHTMGNSDHLCTSLHLMLVLQIARATGRSSQSLLGTSHHDWSYYSILA
jgi:hypothetical protein